ncbi:MAG: hypothetical protein Tsb0017_16320 [Geothermobacteraceae bacterium]
MDPSGKIFTDLFISSLGFAYFIYGKRQRAIIPTLCGIGLMVFPYLVQNLLLDLLIAVILAVTPFLIRS